MVEAAAADRSEERWAPNGLPAAMPDQAGGGPGDFEVALPLFRGPFRLLTDLILDQKVNVCDVPVAAVTGLFLERGRDVISTWSLEEATWFVAMCALLLQLKVGGLMPRPVGGDEEDLLGASSPDLLYARSLELAAFRRVSAVLVDRIAAASLMLPRNVGMAPEFAHLYPDILERVGPEDLRAVAADVLRPPPAIDLTHVTPIGASLSEALQAVRERLAVTPEARFRELLTDCTARIEVVVRFLAILELHREGKVDLVQAEMFGDIAVRWLDVRSIESGEEPEDELAIG